MVIVTGAAIGAVATFPPAVALLSQAGATAAGGVLVPTVAAAEGIAGGVGGAVLAIGEGAVVGAGVIGGGSSGAGIALATLVGPIEWTVVGCSENFDRNGDNTYTWDCWKPIVRDKSAQPSLGMPLRHLATHPNVRSLSVNHNEVLVENTFGEHFRLTPVKIKGILAFHASSYQFDG